MTGVSQMVASVLFGLAALSGGLSAVAVIRSRGGAYRPDRGAALAALILTAIWAGACAALGHGRPPVLLAEVIRNLAWIFLIYRLFANDGRSETVRAVRPLAVALGLVEALQIAFIAAGHGFETAEIAGLAAETSALLRVLVGIGALVLLHNLLAGAADSSRSMLAWITGGLALLWAFLVNRHMVAYLAGPMSPEMTGGTALVVAIAVPIIALGYARGGADLSLRTSRPVTFRLISLALIVIYLFAMVGLSSWLGWMSGDYSRIAQVGFLLAAGALSLLWLPSPKSRKWLQVTILKHFFRHRYDYRSEWIRFTKTIGCAPDETRPLSERAVQSLADITDSQSGLLLLPDGEDVFSLGADWRWSLPDLPNPAMSDELTRLLEREELILGFDEARRGIEHCGELPHLPDWLMAEKRAWAGVPLIHLGRLVGVVILARPLIPRDLDWEDFDILKVAGRQVASYLVEQSSQQALDEAARFDEFNRRMAFVMHDIKNVSSQSSLLLRNAEKHLDNPEFRKDMLITLRKSADKLEQMLARLGRYGTHTADDREVFDLASLARDVQMRFRAMHPIDFVEVGQCRVVGIREAFDQALSHLVQNAIDASDADAPVTIEVANGGLRGSIVVLDRGSGMSPPFVRNQLFKPFVSSKKGGFGIGACEARELVRAMGGRLEVDSREGIGTRFTASLPSADAAHLMSSSGTRCTSLENEAA
ncbi:XrtA/PEP-CTERM system histidine kinase PrsK [Qipengyuania spongiae]|uniref:histidine kinase n=1 Tax=Qipengyuania spongiae TaxID=2909673 RepID=A0ABY5SW48_9SPHN|nr:XrtA/PEP-CTERM system histidine kinase PrsK [Qipengyuania spongiae]UVI38737.1 PEP-CTERM system histidine kinase PrsK [Qipengyuania spongiae]